MEVVARTPDPEHPEFHNFTTSEVLTEDHRSTILAVRNLYRTQRAAGRMLRLLLTDDDVDENDQVRGLRELISWSAVVVQRTRWGLRIRKHVVHRDHALRDLPVGWA